MRFVLLPIECSTSVLVPIRALALLTWQRPPLPATVWNLHGSVWGYIMWSLSTVWAARLWWSYYTTDHAETFGPCQVSVFARVGDHSEHRKRTRQCAAGGELGGATLFG
jgi:hypothetical protein